MMMRNRYLTLMMSACIQQILNTKGIRKTIVTPRYQAMRNSGVMRQERKTLDVD